MYEDFFNELAECLTKHKVTNQIQIIEEYKTKYASLSQSGKSEFECIMSLGDPEEIARKLAGNAYSPEEKLERNTLQEQNVGNAPKHTAKPSSKTSIYCMDIFYWTPITIICTLGLIALAFISGLAGFAGFSYCMIVWELFDTLKEQLLGFGMSLVGVLMFIGGAVITVKLLLSMIGGIKHYTATREAELKQIAENN